MAIYLGHYEDGQIIPESRRIPYLTENQMVYIIPTKKKKPSLESDNVKADEAVVNIKYDNEAKVWVAVSSHLALESESYDELLKLVESVTQDMINHKECPDFDSIKFVTENRQIGIDKRRQIKNGRKKKNKKHV